MKKNFTIKQEDPQKIILKEPGEYTVTLEAEGASVEIVGSFLVKNDRDILVDVTIIHAAPHTSALTTLRSAVDDKASITLNGTIIVRPGAQRTDAILKEEVLLISEKATAHAIPNLEIEADDVKCTHAATISNISKDQLFYLKSRGIKEKEATNLIVEGFLNSVDKPVVFK